MAISLDKKYVYFKETVTLPDAGDDKEFDLYTFILEENHAFYDPTYIIDDHGACGDKLQINSEGIYIIHTERGDNRKIYDKNTGFQPEYEGSDNTITGLMFSGGLDISNEWLSSWVETNYNRIDELKPGTEWIFNSTNLVSLTPWSGGCGIIDLYDWNINTKAGSLYNSNGNVLDIYSDSLSNILSLEYNGDVEWYGDGGSIYDNGAWTDVIYGRFKVADNIPDGCLISPIFISFMDKNATRVSPQEPPTFMPHSITFFDYDGMSTVYKNTFDQWHMVPVERPIPSMPPVKKNYLEIPGSDGVLDLSEFLTGYPLYENREGEFSFYILNGYDTFENIKTEIVNYLHGKKKYMTLIDDPNYLYEGRFEVEFENDDSINHSKCTISYNVKPYKVRFSYTVTSSGWSVEEIFPNERLL